jgi:hypothetical protein
MTQLVKVAAGSLVQFTHYVAGETVTDEVEVKPTCSQDRGQWYCVTHQESFQNQFEKDGHIREGLLHALAWMCSDHGLEQP